MPRSQLRQRLSRAAAGIERSLPVDRRFYLLVAFGFGFVGYFSGMALLGHWTQQPISLEGTVIAACGRRCESRSSRCANHP